MCVDYQFSSQCRRMYVKGVLTRHGSQPLKVPCEVFLAMLPQQSAVEVEASVSSSPVVWAAFSSNSSVERQLTNPSSESSVIVKNTFIDGFADDSDDSDVDGPPMTAVKSLPPMKLKEAQPVFPRLLDNSVSPVHRKTDKAASLSFMVQYVLPPSGSGLPTPSFQRHFTPPESQEPVTPAAPPFPSPDASPTPSSPAVQPSPSPDASPTPSSVGPSSSGNGSGGFSGSLAAHCVVPMDARMGEVSQGSSVHSIGQCRPCAWYWRPQGCSNGKDCRHCHLCSASEVKARKKNRITSLRSQSRLVGK
mmetsp:Transcript_26355/g.87339  ORF Transcript_26355/g.87339 Transcript_26355/m.87339 type:complete len:305 (-) Transcript_26355:182-1096(-)